MHKYHPNIILIKEKIDKEKFSFEQASLCHMIKEIQEINPKKLSTIKSIPPKMLKISSKAAGNVLK